jgi:hypothetical protein
MTVSAGVAVGGGFLLPHGVTAILGALVLVAASIGFAISTTLLFRPSWAKDAWPSVDLSRAEQLRRLRRLAILQGVLNPLLVGGAVWQAVEGAYWFAILVPLSAFNLYSILRAYRASVGVGRDDESATPFPRVD